MGFFGALGRIIQGKPVFEVEQPKPPQQQGGETSAQAPVPGEQPVGVTPVAPSGPKIYPRVYIERVECRMSGNDMELTFAIQNDSEHMVDLDRLEVLGRSQDLGTFLKPGEEREFRVYNGPRPTTSNMNRVVLNFRDQQTADNDAFRSEHTLEFKQEPDRTYSTDRIRFLRVDDV